MPKASDGTDAGATERFYAGLPGLAAFPEALDEARYTPLPDDWVLGLADVVTSTEAIEGGRYKVVNTAGAAVISAVSNALGTLDVPFVFTGDGASFAVGPDCAERATAALAATVAWVSAELGLKLRGGVVRAAAVRAAGVDLRLARFAASPNVSYALFTGGGRDWAERELKAGRLVLPEAGPRDRPNLDGLSCRFRPLASQNGTVLSVIAKARSAAGTAALAEVVAIAEAEPRAGNPVPIDGPERGRTGAGLDVEARLKRRGTEPLVASRVRTELRALAVEALMRRNRPFGGFTPAVYARELAENSDFRKIDDGLMMTLDCSEAAAAGIAARLAAAEREGALLYGLHRQSEALVTCVVPSALRSNHVHFVDGAAGGYATAATALKRKAAGGGTAAP